MKRRKPNYCWEFLKYLFCNKFYFGKGILSLNTSWEYSTVCLMEALTLEDLAYSREPYRGFNRPFSTKRASLHCWKMSQNRRFPIRSKSPRIVSKNTITRSNAIPRLLGYYKGFLAHKTAQIKTLDILQLGKKARLYYGKIAQNRGFTNRSKSSKNTLTIGKTVPMPFSGYYKGF